MITVYIAKVIHILFFVYTAFIFIRLLSSWIPSWQHFSIIRFIGFCTDPFLNIFRRILPPLGGVLDLSPIIAIFVLRILEMIILRILR